MGEIDNQTAAQLLVGKIMFEPDYLDELMENPREALEAVGIEDPTDEMIEAIESLDVESVRSITAAFDQHRIGE
jgi:hypothetical protein